MRHIQTYFTQAWAFLSFLSVFFFSWSLVLLPINLTLSLPLQTLKFLFFLSILFLPHLVRKTSIVFFSNNPLHLLFQDFYNYFYNKMLSIETHCSSSHTPPVSSLASFSFSHFSPITFTDLITIIKSVSSSSCSLDLIPLKILNDLFSFFYPITINLINLLQTTFFKSSIITPILIKPSLDPSIISNYLPISNLSYFSKTLEKAIYF